MHRLIEGSLSPTSGRYAIVAAKFNREVVDLLVQGAIAGFTEHGIADHAIDLVRVPGAFEVPFTAQQLVKTGRYAAIITLGAVIRGDTDHYDYVCKAATDGILRVGLDTGVPVIFGILTCDTDEQAMERAGGKHGNKGRDAAEAAIEMVNLLGMLIGK